MRQNPGRDVVEPVEIGDRLQIRLVLDQLLGPAVRETDMRVDALDHLAVKLKHQPQHAVRGQVLRPEIEGEVWCNASSMAIGSRASDTVQTRVGLRTLSLAPTPNF